MDLQVSEESEVVYNESGRVPEYVCVDYPGYVVCVDNMLQTLGGMDMISHVYSDVNRRLELRFRPSDAYCKPACATRASATGLLVRVTRRVRKKKKQQQQEGAPSAPDSSSVVRPPEDTRGSTAAGGQRCSSKAFQSTLLGVVRTSYSFSTLCDFHYLPLVPVHDSNLLHGHEEDQPRPVPVSKISKENASTRLPTGDSPVSTPSTAVPASNVEEKMSRLATSAACKTDTEPPERLSDPELPSSSEQLHSTDRPPPAKLSVSQSGEDNSEMDAMNLHSDLHHQTASHSSSAPTKGSDEPNSERGYAHPYECFAPPELVSCEWLRAEPQFLFLPPPAFTRMDTPQAYFFRGEESESSSRPQAVSTATTTKSELASSVSATTVLKTDDCASSSSVTCSPTVATSSPSADDAFTEPTTRVACTSVLPAPNVIYRTRQRRTLFAVLCDFDTPTPCEPHPEALKQLNLKFLQRSMSPVYERLKQLFEERPIWGRAGIRSAMGYSSDNLKYLLPTLGYYFTAGPWRNLWIKFGYDPRKRPESFVYQTFNYRLKQSGLIKSYIDAKRNYSSYLLPYKSNAISRKKVSVIQSDLLLSSSVNTKGSTSDISKKNLCLTKKPISELTSPSQPGGDGCKGSSSADDNGDVNVTEEEEEEEEAEKDYVDEGDYSLLDPDGEESTYGDLDGGESTVAEGGESMVGDAEREGSASSAEECLREENYIYRPGCIPPYRQMFYQYCDVLVPEIQQVLERCVLQTSERLRCDPRYGWLNRRVEDECRSIMGRVVDAAVRKRTEQEREQRLKATAAIPSAPTEAAS